MTGKSLARYPLFRLLTRQQLAGWLALGQEIDCPSGTTLLQENTPGAWVHLILDGRVRILRQAGRREISLGMLLPGDVFGEYALLSPGNNTATCRTSTPCRLVRLPLAPLRQAIESWPPVWKNLKNWLRLHTLLHFHRERTFLGFMSAESGLKLHDRLAPLHFLAGQTIQANGLAENLWFVIEQGTVRLGSDESGEAAMVELGPGDSFGERAIAGVGGLPTATAGSDVNCQALSRHVFDPETPARSRVAQSYEPLLPDRSKEQAWVPQEELADCGLAALAMIARRRGMVVTLEQMRRQMPPGEEGLSVAQMRRLAAAIGLPCQAFQVPVDYLGQVSLPVIAHLKTGHYVVLHELGAGGAVVGDPASGIVTWARGFLTERYSGVLLLFDPA